MPVSREDVIAGFEMILGRRPESEAAIEAHLGLADRRALGAHLIASTEFAARRRVAEAGATPDEVYAGYLPADLELFHHFPPWQGEGRPGFITDFLGVRTSLAHVPMAAHLGGAVLGLPIPRDFHAETVEWIGLLKAVLGASGSFCMAELGAGWGPWLAAAAAATARLGVTDRRFYGVEADPTRFGFLQEHLAQNGIPAAECRCINAAMGTAAGMLSWPLAAAPAQDYGTVPTTPGIADYRGYLYADFTQIPVLPTRDLLAMEPRWDLLHVDVQGLELELCRDAAEMLEERVAWLVLGVHSRVLDGGLIELLHPRGWVLEHEKPTRMEFDPAAPSLEAMTRADGVQVWRNPRLAAMARNRP